MGPRNEMEVEDAQLVAIEIRAFESSEARNIVCAIAFLKGGKDNAKPDLL